MRGFAEGDFLSSMTGTFPPCFFFLSLRRGVKSPHAISRTLAIPFVLVKVAPPVFEVEERISLVSFVITAFFRLFPNAAVLGALVFFLKKLEAG
jgi:hypothetical protein